MTRSQSIVVAADFVIGSFHRMCHYNFISSYCNSTREHCVPFLVDTCEGGGCLLAENPVLFVLHLKDLCCKSRVSARGRHPVPRFLLTLNRSHRFNQVAHCEAKCRATPGCNEFSFGGQYGCRYARDSTGCCTQHAPSMSAYNKFCTASEYNTNKLCAGETKYGCTFKVTV